MRSLRLRLGEVHVMIRKKAGENIIIAQLKEDKLSFTMQDGQVILLSKECTLEEGLLERIKWVIGHYYNVNS